MKNKMTLKVLVLFVALIVTNLTYAQNKTVVDIAVGSSDHTTLVAAVKAADLVNTLSSDGPFTVFAPTDAAFKKLPAGTLDMLLKPENKDQLKNILIYHVISGMSDGNAVVKAIQDGKGKAVFTTVSGEKITAMLDGVQIKLKDKAGNVYHVTVANLKASNGVVHVIDGVLMPKK
ncbi:fasciclin domain-containing protein [Gangjinia marincola]|uniref:Fasciclin domain-containing protein n=1 Tax=Gangjinia marincola TaxID=578463 RepID=A0ABN1MCU0_9FLAO